MIKTISLLGTGAMGSRIAKHLILQNYHVTLYNRSKSNSLELIEMGAEYFATPSQAVNNADVVISMLSDDNAAKWVWLNANSGALASMKKEAIAIESSTLSVECIGQLSDAFKKADIAFLDAPVLGSRPQAEAAALIYLVGGNEAVLNRVSRVLEKLSSAIYYMGKSGNGTIMKLAVNAYFSAQVNALSEVLGVLQKAGIEKQHSIELFNQLPTTSPALQGIGNLIASENHQPFFPINLVEKDLSYMQHLANQINAPMPATRSTLLCFKQAIEKGLGNNNISGISQLYM